MFRFTKKIIKEQNGQAFPLALVILAMGSLFVTGFLSAANTSVLTSKVYSDPIPDNYAADAGIEDAIWGLLYDNLDQSLQASGGQLDYLLSDEVNGLTANVSVTGSGGIIAFHYFDNALWAGGEGWLGAWEHVGSCTMITSQNPYQGARHLQIRGANALISRAVDLSGYSNLRLMFWAKTRTLESNDRMYCMVSPDGLNWTTVFEWDANPVYETYTSYDIDLSPFTMSSEFWIRFDSGMDSNNDYFYLDYLRIGGDSGYKIISVAGERTATATVEIGTGAATILSWEVE